ncbi:uncharacterized protein LOC133141599 [Conger conger]|uniref:uncharacterized protein LOC133141599 n=1 Tax=Conger conger TaxID=82655 RepID=UPI002A5A4172|nr:uncharacterized protein LOC133141599 [Conger conger]
MRILRIFKMSPYKPPGYIRLSKLAVPLEMFVIAAGLNSVALQPSFTDPTTNKVVFGIFFGGMLLSGLIALCISGTVVCVGSSVQCVTSTGRNWWAFFNRVLKPSTVILLLQLNINFQLACFRIIRRTIFPIADVLAIVKILLLPALGLILFLQNKCGCFSVRGPAMPLLVQLGASVTLPCSVDTPIPLHELEVQWMRDSGSLVHLFLGGESRPESQSPAYSGRAEFFTEEISKGNFSLLLRNATTEDKGMYKCVVHTDRESSETNVTIDTERLVVTGADVPVFAYTGEDVILNCSVDTHVPLGELEVEWMKTNEEIQVLLFMEGRYRPESQPERFRGRAEFFSEEIPKVALQPLFTDPTVKTGDKVLSGMMLGTLLLILGFAAVISSGTEPLLMVLLLQIAINAQLVCITILMSSQIFLALVLVTVKFALLFAQDLMSCLLKRCGYLRQKVFLLLWLTLDIALSFVILGITLENDKELPVWMCFFAFLYIQTATVVFQHNTDDYDDVAWGTVSFDKCLFIIDCGA